MVNRPGTIAQVISLLSFAVITSSVAAADPITGSRTGGSTTEVGTAAVSVSTPLEADSATATSYQVPGTALFDDAGSSLLLISASQQIDLFAPREKLRFGSWSGIGGAHGAGGFIPEDVITGLGNGVPSGSIGNVSFSSGNLGSGADSGVGTVATPEPSSLILLASGLALARRAVRARRQRQSA